jgi:hypothetical protein
MPFMTNKVLEKIILIGWKLEFRQNRYVQLIPQNMNENGPVVAEIIKDIYYCESEILILVTVISGFRLL